MTKQQIVVQLVAAKIASREYVCDTDLARYGKLADMIIEMFPEHDYSVSTKLIAEEIAGGFNGVR